MSQVFAHSRATGNDRVVLLVLADHAHDDGAGAYPSQGTIARKAGGISERCVRDCLARLEGMDEIARNGKHGRAVEYRVTIAANPAGIEKPESGSRATETGEQPPHHSGNGLPLSYEPSGEPSETSTAQVGGGESETAPEPGGDGEWAEWLEHYRTTTGRTARGSSSARRKFRARRREGRPLADLKAATAGCHGDEYCRTHAHDVPDTILRTSKVDRYIELAKSKPGAGRSSGSIASIRRDDQEYGSTLEAARPYADNEHADDNGTSDRETRAQGAQGGR